MFTTNYNLNTLISQTEQLSYLPFLQLSMEKKRGAGVVLEMGLRAGLGSIGLNGWIW